jgi:fatty-acyl-CoA synthase
MKSRRSYYHRGGEAPLLGVTIPEHFAEVARAHGDRAAVVGLPQGRRLSYAELAGATDELARGLLAVGFGPGDRVGIWSTNNIEWLLLQLATARIGAVLVNINPAYRPKELAYALEKSEVQGLFTIPAFRGSDYVGMLRELIPALDEPAQGALSCDAYPALRQLVVYDPAAPGETRRPAPGFGTWQEVIAAGREVSAERLAAVSAALDPDEPINIQYTSGTTGFPKAVVLTHHNILNNAWFAAHALHLAAGERLAVSVPFYHCFGMVLSNLLCLSVGACIVIPCEHFDPGAVLSAVATERCTAVHGVPTMFIAMLEHPDFERYDLSALRTGIMAGAPCPPELMRRVMTDMHCPEILIGYGQTEASPLTHLTTREDSVERRVETVGRNLPHQEVKIVDAKSRRTAPLGEVGEVCFRGYHVMQGYYADRTATAEAIDDHGWLASGDLGTMDAEGYVKITGRLKEMIIRGGENIYPREIEDLLFTHPKVAEAAVFGIPDEFYGEDVAVWIQLHEGETATEEEMRDFLKHNLAHFKVPKRIRFVEDFPMTVTGKLKKFRMREFENARRDHAGEPEPSCS